MIAIDTNILMYAHRVDSESADYWPTLKSQIQTGRVTGPRMHDARIAAVCLNHGVTEFWTADRDFNRFPGLSCQNPLF